MEIYEWKINWKSNRKLILKKGKGKKKKEKKRGEREETKKRNEVRSFL